MMQIIDILLDNFEKLNSNDKERISHQDLKSLKTLFSTARSMQALNCCKTDKKWIEAFGKVSEGVGVISMKNKQVMTYWNKTLLEVEFNQKHIEREKDAIKEKEKDKKESESNGVNGVDKDKEAMQDVQNNKRKG